MLTMLLAIGAIGQRDIPLPTATPLIENFRIRYPALAATSDARIQYWITDAASYVGDWGLDTDPAILAYAAHQIVVTAPGEASAGVLAGVTRFHSASVDISMTEFAANLAARGGWGASPYGIEFEGYLRRHNGGPRLVGCVEAFRPCW